MNNAVASLNVAGHIYWYNGSSTDITLGTITCNANWNFYNGCNVNIPVEVTTYLVSAYARNITCTSTTAHFGNLVIEGSGSIVTYTIDAASTQPLLVSGNLIIDSSRTLNLNTQGMTVNGYLDLEGTLQINNGAALVMGILDLDAASTLTIGTGSLTCESSSTPRTTYLRGTLNINAGALDLLNNSLSVNNGSINNLTNATINCTGISAIYTNTFKPTGGTVVLGNLFAGGTSGIQVSNANWLPDLTIDAGTQGYYLATDIIIKGDLSIASGGLDAQDGSSVSHNITLAGNWSNTGGTFYPRTGRVTFNGSAHQYVNNTETFNIMEANKSAGAIRVDNAAAVVTCAKYDWTAGSVDVLEGTLTINDLADNGMYGGFYSDLGGIMNLTQDAAQTINLYGTIQVTGGTMNIYGGNGDAYWAGSSASTVSISGGFLHYHNQGLQIRNTFALTYSITGGTISTTGDLYCYRTDFNPSAGTFEMRGATDTVLNFPSTAGSSLYGLSINKSSISAKVSQTTNSLKIQSNVNILYGTYYLGTGNRTLNNFGNLTVYANGILDCYDGSTVTIGSGQSLTVLEGGEIKVIGIGTNTIFTHASAGSYAFTIGSGGILNANWVTFEYMNTMGLNVMAGAIISRLEHCTFQNGAAGGNLFRVGNQQDLIIPNANFPTNAGSGAKNVYKPYSTGSITFSNYSGVFGGAVFEDDPYDKVFWTGSSANLVITGVTWTRPDNYVCAPISSTVTVQNNGADDIFTTFRVDLYKNLNTAPG